MVAAKEEVDRMLAEERDARYEDREELLTAEVRGASPQCRRQDLDRPTVAY